MNTDNLYVRDRAERQVEQASSAAYVLGLFSLLLSGMRISAATLEGWPAVASVAVGLIIWGLGYGVSRGNRLAAVLLACLLLQGIVADLVAGRIVGGVLEGLIFGYFIFPGVPGTRALHELRRKERSSITPSEKAAV